MADLLVCVGAALLVGGVWAYDARAAAIVAGLVLLTAGGVSYATRRPSREVPR